MSAAFSASTASTSGSHVVPSPPPSASSSMIAEASTISGLSLATSSGPSRPLRVSQLDSIDLDDALVGMLGQSVSESFDDFNPSAKVQFQPELYLVIQLVLYKLGMWDRLVTPGGKLQNLRYTPTKWGSTSSRKRLRTILFLHLFLTPSIFPKYLLTRFKHYALSRAWPDLPRRSWRKRAWDLMGKLEDVGKAGELLGLLWFLYDGGYPSLLTRTLGLRLLPSQPILSRMVSYEFMNRQLVWGSLAQFLPFCLPFIPTLARPISQFRTRLSGVFGPLAPMASYDPPPDYAALSSHLMLQKPGAPGSSLLFSASPDGENTSDQDGMPTRPHEGPYANLSPRTCPICYAANGPPSSQAASNASAPPAVPRLPGLPTIPAGPPSSDALATGNVDPSPSSSEEDPAAAVIADPNEAHVPVRADCWGRCTYCYFCLGEALVRAQEREAEAVRTGEKSVEESEAKGWECLRCGGEVWGCEREGPVAEEEDEEDEEKKEGGAMK